MREIPKKNYLILAVLLVVTILLTLMFSNIYKNKEKLVSAFYLESNNIAPNEFDEYLMENPDLIIYVSDKYDLSHEKFEEDFENKLKDLNIKNNLVYIDKNEIDKSFINKLKNEYDVNIDISKTPLIIVMVEKSVTKVVQVSNDSNVDSIINYEVFK